MSPEKAEKVLISLLLFIGILTIAGITLLFAQASSARLAAFELMAFSISVIAVTLAILGSIANLHQIRTMKRIARDIKAAISSLKHLDADNESIKRKIHKDYEVARDIAEALSEAGIMSNDTEKRKNLAGKIQSKIQKNTKKRN